MAGDEQADLWKQVAARWAQMGPPLRPSAEEVALLGAQLASAGHSIERILVLGSTPDYHALGERFGASVVACDQSHSMLQGIWQRPDRAVQGNWLKLPYIAESFDAVVGDGIFTLLPFPTAYRSVSAEIHRVLRPGGVFGVRSFLDAHRDDGPEKVLSLLADDAISNAHELRFRLLMALQRDPHEGIAVRDLAEWWRGQSIELDFSDPRWAALEMLEVYAASPGRYSFPILDELREVLSKDLDEAGCGATGTGFARFCTTTLWRRPA